MGGISSVNPHDFRRMARLAIAGEIGPLVSFSMEMGNEFCCNVHAIDQRYNDEHGNPFAVPTASGWQRREEPYLVQLMQFLFGAYTAWATGGGHERVPALRRPKIGLQAFWELVSMLAYVDLHPIMEEIHARIPKEHIAERIKALGQAYLDLVHRYKIPLAQIEILKREQEVVRDWINRLCRILEDSSIKKNEEAIKEILETVQEFCAQFGLAHYSIVDGAVIKETPHLAADPYWKDGRYKEQIDWIKEEAEADVAKMMNDIGLKHYVAVGDGRVFEDVLRRTLSIIKGQMEYDGLQYLLWVDILDAFRNTGVLDISKVRQEAVSGLTAAALKADYLNYLQKNKLLATRSGQIPATLLRYSLARIKLAEAAGLKINTSNVTLEAILNKILQDSLAEAQAPPLVKDGKLEVVLATNINIPVAQKNKLATFITKKLAKKTLKLQLISATSTVEVPAEAIEVKINSIHFIIDLAKLPLVDYKQVKIINNPIPPQATILLSGGAGYVGSFCARKLIKEGYNVIIYDNLSSGNREFLPAEAVFIEGDLEDTRKLEELFTTYHIDAVMNFAASIEVGESRRNPGKYFYNNTINTINLIEIAAKHGVKYFIHSSTAAVYGEPKHVPIEEIDPLDANNAYGESKLAIERAMAYYEAQYSMHFVRFRYFNVDGASDDATLGEYHVQKETHIIPRLIFIVYGWLAKFGIASFQVENQEQKDYFLSKERTLPDPTPFRDYVNVQDLADAHELAIGYLMRGGATAAFNLGTGEGSSLKQVIDAVQRWTGQELRLK